MYENNLLKADIDISASGDSEIIAAPSEGFIAIDHINFLPTSAVSVQLKSGSDAYGADYPLDGKQAFTLENAFNSHKGVITCGNEEAFNINLNGAVQVSGFVRYRVVV